MIASAPKVFVPFADKDPENWHEGIYDFYELCEVALGLRQEVSQEEADAANAYSAAEEAIMAGDRDWMKHINPNYDATGVALDEFLGMNNNLEKIAENEEKRAQMQAFDMGEFFNMSFEDEE